MRRSLRKSLGQRDTLPSSHAGLIYERYAPIEHDGADPGKVPPDDADPWLDAISRRIRRPEGYDLAFKRWQSSFLEDDGAEVFQVKTRSRLLIGAGGATPTEVGLTLHHTWGVPVIPGSALKGLLSHYIQVLYGPGSPSSHPLAHPDDTRSPYQGVIWDQSSIQHGPGWMIRELFGAPDARSDAQYEGQHPDDVGAIQGSVVFHDAWWLPKEGTTSLPIERDVLTVHQRQYYSHQGQSWPNDYDSPNPVSFLSVAPGTDFLVALSGDTRWTAFARNLLNQALDNWGVGAKTAAGYGRASAIASGYDLKQERLDQNPLVQEVQAVLAGEGSQRTLFQSASDQILSALEEGVPSPILERAVELIERRINNSSVLRLVERLRLNVELRERPELANLFNEDVSPAELSAHLAGIDWGTLSAMTSTQRRLLQGRLAGIEEADRVISLCLIFLDVSCPAEALVELFAFAQRFEGAGFFTEFEQRWLTRARAWDAPVRAVIVRLLEAMVEDEDEEVYATVLSEELS